MNRNIFDVLELSIQLEQEYEKVILVDGYAQLTVRGIYERALRIGSFLLERGLFNQPVAVLADHSADTILCFLGILASGNYYIPLAPDMKRERFEKIQRMSGFQLVMGRVQQPPEWMNEDRCVCYVSSQEAQAESCQDDTRKAETLALHRQKLPEDAPMYLVFTSGSTGEPKGIIKTHEGLIHFLEAYIEEFGFLSSDCMAGQTPFYFDASAKDIYLALKLKCRFHILEESYFVRPMQLAEYLRDEHITVIQWVPSALGMLSRFRVFEQVQLPELRMVLSVGEALPVKQLKIWMDGVPDAEYINLYGSSEVSGICTFYRVRHLEEGQETIPIGYPLKCCRIDLIADGHVVAEKGKMGEIYVSGSSLAAGYLHDSGAFAVRPYPELSDQIYFKSGDLAEYGARGELLFLSRKDHQIKHMGHRIELGEIEAEVLKISQIQNCCCIYENAKQKIVLFYEGDCVKSQVSAFLKKELASYMLPNKLIQIEQGAWPLNANGKTDRIKLKEKYLTHTRIKQTENGK